MKQPVRFFAIGLFTASFIIFIIFLFNNTSNDASDLTVEQMIESIETDGYRVITEEDYISYTINKDQIQQNEIEDEKKAKEKKREKKDDKKAGQDKQQADPSSKQEKEKPEEKTVKSYTVKVKSGMMPEEIAKLLEKNDIIDDAFSFSTYLEDNGYSPYVQIGSFKVKSDMSRKEIAELITKNRRP